MDNETNASHSVRRSSGSLFPTTPDTTGTYVGNCLYVLRECVRRWRRKNLGVTWHPIFVCRPTGAGICSSIYFGWLAWNFRISLSFSSSCWQTQEAPSEEYYTACTREQTPQAPLPTVDMLWSLYLLLELGKGRHMLDYCKMAGCYYSLLKLHWSKTTGGLSSCSASDRFLKVIHVCLALST
jgi:hypothetical protein